LGITYNHDHPIQDPEKVLPVVLDKVLPTILKGFVVSGLLAAAMSTFDSTINSGAAYYVKDIYQAFINPNASERTLIIHSRVSSIVLSIIGLGFTLIFANINEVWGFITITLKSSLFVPLIARWIYWRVNGWGFGCGIIGGVVAAILLKFTIPHTSEWVTFLWVITLSSISLAAATFLSPPTDITILRNFYWVTRPAGFWGPITSGIRPDVMRLINKENRRDLSTAYSVALPFQVSLFILWMTISLLSWIQMVVVLALFAACASLLYILWYRYLNEPEIIVIEGECIQERSERMPVHENLDKDGSLIPLTRG